MSSIALVVFTLISFLPISSIALVEFAASHKMREAMNDYKKDGKDFGSVIEVKGEEVMLGKFMSRYNQAMSWLRSHPPKGLNFFFCICVH